MSNYPTQEPSMYTGIDSFGGINWSINASRIADNEATAMENFVITESGVLSKRRGIKGVSKLLVTKLYNMIPYKNKLVLGTSSGIYEYDNTTDTNKQLLGGSCSANVNFFIMNNILYILNGTFFYEYNGTTIKRVEDSAYTPTLFITCAANGGGTPYEQWNMLHNKYKMSFSADGTSKDYISALAGEVSEVLLDNVVVAPANYTASSVNGKTKVTFTTAPAKGTDNLVITYAITIMNTGGNLLTKITANKDRINKSTIWSLYGGQNDTRLLLAGQDSIFYRSAVYNPYYFPENYYQGVGDTEEKITGFVTQYDYCVILKERSIWYTKIDMLQDGSIAYSTKPLNSQIGCINPKSVQLIENSPMFLSKKGIAVVSQTQIRDERNVTIISDKINTTREMVTNGLLKETLSNGATIDYDNKYMYVVKNKVYIYDYKYNVFYTWILPSWISVLSMAELNGELYFGSETGALYKYKAEGEVGDYNGCTSLTYQDEYISGITSYTSDYSCKWKSKLFSFDNYSKYKLIENMFLSISPSEHTSVVVKYVTDNNTVIDVGTVSNNLMNYANTNYGSFSYTSTYFPVIDNLKIRAKKILFFQVVFENSNPLESLDVFNIGIKYKYQREVKP